MSLSSTSRYFIAVAALMAAAAVILSAYASHGLASWASVQQVSQVKLAAQYQLIHAIAILVTSLLMVFNTSKLLFAAQLLFCVGIACFSGSLYYLVFMGSKLLVMMTPFGGVLLILAWLMMVVAMLRNRK